MAEYIERLAVISAIKKYEIENCPEYMQDWVTKLKEAVLGDITDIVLELPAADVAPAVHGWWIEVTKIAGVAVLKCSACGKEHPMLPSTFCRDCGAKMQEVR